MDHREIVERLDQRIANLEAERETIEAELEKLKGWRATLESISTELLSDKEGDGYSEGLRLPQKTHYERIADFLREATRAQSTNEIEEGTGIPSTSLAAVLYRTHKDEFIRRPDPQGGRAVVWALVDSELGRQIIAREEVNEIPF